jgi:2-octaprenyl-6-methoxyphenol hydroxylase
MSNEEFDVIVAGGGPAGLVAACLVAARGKRTALVTGSTPAGEDPRTVALMQPAIRLLENLGVFPGGLAAHVAPLRRLRLVDDTGSLISVPEVVFDSKELGSEPFGWNIPLSRLQPILHATAIEAGVVPFAVEVSDFRAESEQARICLSDGRTLSAPLVVAADGRDSRVRQAAGIGIEEWAYDQSAIATSFAHSAAHHDTSSEYHRSGGPFTTVPLPGRRSSLVWMERTERAAALMALDDDALASEIQLATHGDLGRIGNIGPRRLFPMRGLRARQLAGPRLMLIGEAAHVVPPIGAQGLNMSFRDAAEVTEMISKHSDPGSAEAIAQYAATRQGDIRPRQAVIDLVNRSLLADALWLDGGRSAGLTALANFAPLRHFAMRRGLKPPGPLPGAMQPRR